MGLTGNPPLELGGTFLDMRVEALLGSGGSAWVYRVHEPLSELEYALKLIPCPSSCPSSREVAERTRREFHILHDLDHPNVVQVVRAGITADSQYLYVLMELAEGLSLRDVLQAVGAFNVQELLTIGIQLCDAADAAHSRGIVHRDLKPENVVLGPVANEVKVLDFGIAKVLGTPSNTGEHNLIGTPLYMSPERILRNETTPLSDVYAIGVMLDEMARGAHFVTTASANASPSAAFVSFLQLTHLPAPLHDVVQGFPRALSDVIRQAMAKEPAARYQSARELRDALAELDETMFGRHRAMLERELVREAELLLHPRVELSAMRRSTTEHEEPVGPPTAKGGADRLVEKMVSVTTRKFDVRPLLSRTTVREHALVSPFQPCSAEKWNPAALFGATLRSDGERVPVKGPLGARKLLRDARDTTFSAVSIAVLALALSAARSAEAPTSEGHQGRKASRVTEAAVVPATVPAIFREPAVTTRPALLPITTVERSAGEPKANAVAKGEPSQAARADVSRKVIRRSVTATSPGRQDSARKELSPRLATGRPSVSREGSAAETRRGWTRPVAPLLDEKNPKRALREKPRKPWNDLNNIVDPWAPLVAEDSGKRPRG